jgi:hypothetical protein
MYVYFSNPPTPPPRPPQKNNKICSGSEGVNYSAYGRLRVLVNLGHSFHFRKRKILTGYC